MPKGYAKKGHRIVRGRSAKQRAHAQRYGTLAPGPGRSAAAREAAPTMTPASSWWIATSREDFMAAHRAQLPRLHEAE